jgi:hypothetical protein
VQGWKKKAFRAICTASLKRARNATERSACYRDALQIPFVQWTNVGPAGDVEEARSGPRMIAEARMQFFNFTVTSTGGTGAEESSLQINKILK